MRPIPRIELSVRLSDGSFESNLSMPTTGGDPERQELVESWLLLLDKALKVARAAQPKDPVPEVGP